MSGCNIITDISVDNCRLTLTNQDSEIVAQFLLGNTTYTLFSDRIFIRDTETSWQLYSTAFPISGLTTMQDLADLIDASIVGCDSGGGGGSYYLYSENYDAGSFYASTVTGLNAVSIGVANTASGDYSTAIGGGNTASGEVSISIGTGNNASGKSSMATGYETTAKSYVETSFGFQNTDYTPISDIAFEPTDRLIVVGNGGSGNLSDAFTILKNGKTAIGIDNFETTTSEAKLQVNGFYATTIEIVNIDTTLNASSCASITIVDNSASTKTITLPIASEMFFNGMTARIKIKRKSKNHNITINPQSGSNIDGATHYDYTGNDVAFEFVTDGTNWYKL
jgi:hypothetical protein